MLRQVTAPGSARVPAPAALGPAMVETHISVVLFVGDRVYKLRKPVRFGFLDFSTRQAREADCYREVVLNRRLAPDVYLGVADVVIDGVPIDHLVVMRRLPEDRRLSAMVRSGEDLSGCLRDLARTLASFHASAERSATIDVAARREAVTASWEGNFAETATFVGRYLDAHVEARIRELVHRYLAGREPLFRRRIAEGQVCDGHGDLRADDIYCLDDGPRVLDCVEFDPGLRHGDVLADLAFLTMDLERLGAKDASRQLLADYQELSGAVFPSSLVRHYMASRAYVRAKVACLRAAQGDHWAAQAAPSLQKLCLSYLEQGQVRLILVGGRPASDPSTLALDLAETTSASMLRFEEVRLELAGSGAGPTTGAELRQLALRTFRTMFDRAATALGLGESVVLDAPWWPEVERVAAGLVAGETHSQLVELATVDGSGQPGVGARAAHPAGWGAVEVAGEVESRPEPWPEATAIDTSGPRRHSLDQGLAALGRSDRGPGLRRAHREEEAEMAKLDTRETGHEVLAAERTPIGELSLRKLVTVPPGATLGEVARQLEEANVSSALVETQGLPRKFVSERDLARGLARGLGPADPVETVATKGPVWATTSTTLGEAAEMMVQHEIRHLLVLTAGGEAAGVLSMRDVFPVLLRRARQVASRETGAREAASRAQPFS